MACRDGTRAATTDDYRCRYAQRGRWVFPCLVLLVLTRAHLSVHEGKSYSKNPKWGTFSRTVHCKHSLTGILHSANVALVIRHLGDSIFQCHIRPLANEHSLHTRIQKKKYLKHTDLLQEHLHRFLAQDHAGAWGREQHLSWTVLGLRAQTHGGH